MDGGATDTCFALFGAHHCGIVMIDALTASAENTCVSRGVDLEAASHPASTIITPH